MPVPLQIQLFDAFLGQQEGIHSAILPDLFSSGGSKNVFIDKFARVKKISGYTKQNVSARTTDTGASTAIFRSCFPYRKTSGGSITRQLVGVLDDGVNEWEVWTSTDNGVTWTFRYDAGASPIGIPADFAQFGDDLFITNGKVAPRRWDGTTMSAAGSTQSPTPTASSTGTGNLKGNYRYKLVSMVGDVRQIGSASSSAVAISAAQGSLSWTADANGSVTGYEVYRTTGTGTVFFFVDYVDGRTTVAYTDNLGDTELVAKRTLAEHGDAPPTSYFVESHRNRVWWLRTDTNPTRAYFSDPNDGDSVYTNNYLDFSDSDTQGDQITGGFGNFGSKLIVTTERAVWTVDGTGALIGFIYDWNKQRSNAQTGAVAGRSIARVPAGARYSDQNGDTKTVQTNMIAYWTPLGDVRLFDGQNDIIISHPLKTTLSTFNYANRNKIWALHDTTNQQIIWFYPDASAGECNKAVAWNYKWGVWYAWPSMPMAAGCEVDGASTATTLLTFESSIAKGGFCYTFLSGNSFDGTAINAAWMTKTLRGEDENGKPAPERTKRWRWADILFRITENVSLTLEWMPGWATDDATGEGSAVISPNPGTLVTSDGFSIAVSDGVTLITISLESSQGKVLLHKPDGIYMHDTGCRLRVSDNASNGSWALESISLAYQVLPGQNRRLQ